MNAQTDMQKQDAKQHAEVTRAERTRDARTYVPNVDIVEQADGLLLVADMPGVRAEDVDIQYEQGLLTIQGRVQARHDDVGPDQYMLREYGVGDFYRSFRVGEGVDIDKIRAELKNGVMTLHLPKAEALKPRKISVKTT